MHLEQCRVESAELRQRHRLGHGEAVAANTELFADCDEVARPTIGQVLGRHRVRDERVVASTHSTDTCTISNRSFRALAINARLNAVTTSLSFRLQCFDAVGWAAGRASGL